MRLLLCCMYVASATICIAQCEQGGAAERQSYSLYREFYLQKNYEDALPHCRNVIKRAPGLRKTTFHNASVMYHSLLGKGDTTFVDTLLNLYQQQMHCWGDSAKILQKIAALKLKYYPEKEDEALALIRLINKIDSAAPDRSFYKVWFNLERRALHNRLDSSNYLLDCYFFLLEHADSSTLQWAISSLPDSLKNCELVERQFRMLPADSLSNWKRIQEYYRLGCKDSEKYRRLLNAFIKANPNAEALGYALDFTPKSQWLTLLDKQFKLQKDSINKAKTLLKIASVARMEKQFPVARSYALRALMFKPNWGEAYVAIGDLYIVALTDKTCSDIDRQLLILLALDYYQRALATEDKELARARINKYREYMPGKSDMFWQHIYEGDTYHFGCWIKEKTVVRLKDS